MNIYMLNLKLNVFISIVKNMLFVKSNKNYNLQGFFFYYVHLNFNCDAPKPGGPLTTRQPMEYSWMSGNPTPFTKIGQSLLCTRALLKVQTCPHKFTMTTQGPHMNKNE